ncbi:MAG: hypothetical protein ACI910_000600, partial [Oleispira sp.]
MSYGVKLFDWGRTPHNIYKDSNMDNSIQRRIILFGQQNLQNSILIGFIHQRTNIDCQLISTPEWQTDWNSFEGQTLALIDADSARTERLQDLLDQIFDQNKDIQVAFFNTHNASSIERL